MNENAKRWVEALRSGEYEQTNGCLHDSRGYCCLGVACDVYLKETGRGRWGVMDGGGIGFAIDGPLTNGHTLLDGVRAWLGVNSSICRYAGDPLHRSLAGRNDDGASFAEIADIIESEPEGLFA